MCPAPEEACLIVANNWQAAWPEKGLRLWGCVPRPLPRSLQGPGWLPRSSDVQKELISCATCPELL